MARCLTLWIGLRLKGHAMPQLRIRKIESKEDRSARRGTKRIKKGDIIYAIQELPSGLFYHYVYTNPQTAEIIRKVLLDTWTIQLFQWNFVGMKRTLHTDVTL